MKIYAKKPEKFLAIQWTGKNVAEMRAFLNDPGAKAIQVEQDQPFNMGSGIFLTTVDIGDYVVKGNGVVFRNNPAEFKATYYEARPEEI